MAGKCGMDYIRAAFKREFEERIPVSVSMGAFLAKLGEVPLKRFFTESDKMVEATLRGYDIVRPDTLVSHIDLNLETEAMGNVVEFVEDGNPLVRKKLLSENMETLLKLKVPDPEKDGRA